MDCHASTKLVEFMGKLDVQNYISGFTFSHRLNLYWETHQAILDNCDRIYTELEDNVVFDTYEYSRESVIKLQKLNEKMHFGNDFTWFLTELLSSQYDTFYIQIY